MASYVESGPLIYSVAWQSVQLKKFLSHTLDTLLNNVRSDHRK